MIRNVLDRFAAWLGYIPADAPREFRRINNGADAITRGQRWESFYAEEGGLADMVASLRSDYFEAYAALRISERDKQYEYVLADRLLRQIDREVRMIIETGKLKTKERDQSERNAAMRNRRGSI